MTIFRDQACGAIIKIKWSHKGRTWWATVHGVAKESDMTGPLKTQMIRVDPWPNGAGALIKKKKKKWKRHQSCLSLHHMRTQWRSNWLQARKKVLIRNQISQHLDLGPPSLQNCAQIYFCNLRPPVCGTFVMAEKSKTNIQKWHPSLPLVTVILFFFFFFYNSRYFRICSYT